MKKRLPTILIIVLLTKICAGQFSFERRYNSFNQNSEGTGCQVLSSGFAVLSDVNPCGLCIKYNDYLQLDSLGNIVNEKTYNLNQDSKSYILHKSIGDTLLISGVIQNFNVPAYDIYVIKIDAFGNSIWRKEFIADSLNSDMIPISICNTIDSCYFVLYQESAKGIRYMKINSNGDSLFARKIGYPFTQGAQMILMHDSGFAILTTNLIGINGPFDIIRLNAAGDTIRSFDFNLDSVGVLSKFVETTDQGFVILGNIRDSIHHNPMTIWKIDSLGTLIWHKSIYTNYVEDFYELRNCTDNGYIVTGTTLDQPNQLSRNFLYRSNSNGDSLWFKEYEPQLSSGFNDVQQTTENGFISVGTIANGFNPNDIFVVRTDSMGIVSSNLGIIFLSKQNRISIFPNPIHDHFSISWPENNFRFEVKLIDISGRMVFNDFGFKQINTFEISGLSKGFYVLNVSNGESSSTLKLIIE